MFQFTIFASIFLPLVIASSSNTSLDNAADVTISGANDIIFGNEYPDVVKGDGLESTVHIKCRPFNHVQIQGRLQVELWQGNSYSLQIIGDSNLLELVETVSQSNTLVIGMKNDLLYQSNNIIRVVLEIPENAALKFITVLNLGIFISKTLLNVGIVYLLAIGSGRIQGAFNGQIISSKISGSGHVVLRGSCQELVCDVVGNGNADAVNVVSDMVQVRVRSGGNAIVNAKDILFVDLNGSGHVVYKGNPYRKVFKSFGPGEIKKHQ